MLLPACEPLSQRNEIYYRVRVRAFNCLQTVKRLLSTNNPQTAVVAGMRTAPQAPISDPCFPLVELCGKVRRCGLARGGVSLGVGSEVPRAPAIPSQPRYQPLPPLTSWLLF